MGVYISGLEIPPKGKGTLVILCSSGAVYSGGQKVGTAVPVPPHGRLIDADELHSALRKRAKEFSNSEYGDGVKCGLADAREYIKIATTIIPAEEGE